MKTKTHLVSHALKTASPISPLTLLPYFFISQEMNRHKSIYRSLGVGRTHAQFMGHSYGTTGQFGVSLCLSVSAVIFLQKFINTLL